jgi:hypothetical protein
MLDSFLPTGRISSLLNMQPKFLVLEVQKITNFLELTFFLDLAGPWLCLAT